MPFTLSPEWKVYSQGNFCPFPSRFEVWSSLPLPRSVRYAWAKGAITAGYPERFAQSALGHNSKAVHRAYAKKAQVTLLPLEEYEQKIVQFTPSAPIPEPRKR